MAASISNSGTVPQSSTGRFGEYTGPIPDTALRSRKAQIGFVEFAFGVADTPTAYPVEFWFLGHGPEDPE